MQYNSKNSKTMSHKRFNDRRIDMSQNLNFHGLINTGLYLSQYKQQPQRKVIVKQIHMQTDPMQVQRIMKKMSTLSVHYLKPQAYDYRDGKLYYCTPLQHLSLQSLIWIHRKQGRQVGRQFIRQFTVRMYQGLVRLKHSDVFPGNMKPSNLFLEQRDEKQGQYGGGGGWQSSRDERNWLWAEASMPTINYVPYYSKISLQGNKSQRNIDPQQNQFYALGIILLELITLRPVQEIDEVVRSGKDWRGIQNYQDNADYYGPNIIEIIKSFVKEPRNTNLYYMVQDYKKLVQNQESSPNYERYYFTFERLERFLKKQLLKFVEEKAKAHIVAKQLSARQIFDLLAMLDPKLDFGFTDMLDFQRLLQKIGVTLDPEELLFMTTYFYSRGYIRYFRILQRVFPSRELIEAIIIKAIEGYDNSFKDFFQAQTNSDVWKVQGVKKFLQTIEIYFEEKEIVQTMKAWTGTQKTSIKKDQLYKILKPALGLSMSLSKSNFAPNISKSDIKQGQGPIQGVIKKLLQQLMQKQPDLVSFFRKQDLRQNWIVDQRIQKHLKKYIKADQSQFKNGFIQMYQKGNIPGDFSKQINYIYLLRRLQLYDSVELFKMVITQKANEVGRQLFYQQYKKDQRGWSRNSLVDFNQKQNLEFGERQLNMLFGQFDDDRSGHIDQQELYFRLTGLKQFDFLGFQEQLTDRIKRQGLFLFDFFRGVDPRGKLMLSKPEELDRVLNQLGFKLSEDHIDQLFHNQHYYKKGNFSYINFLLQYHKPSEIFVAATKFVIKIDYRNDFQKLFHMGLKQGKKKWHQESLGRVNEELVLTFSDNIVREVWKLFDPTGQGSLTKQEVATLFRYQFQQTDQLKPRYVQNIHDYAKKRGQDSPQKSRTKSFSPIPPPPNTKDGKQNILLRQFSRLGQKDFIKMAQQMVYRSDKYNGQLQQSKCQAILMENRLKFNKNEQKQIFSRFKINQNRRVTINFVGWCFFIIQTVFKQFSPKNIQKMKADLCIGIIKQIKRNRKISNSQLFTHCRLKDRMRETDFQDIFKELVEVDVYGDDIEQAWYYWGQQYLDLRDFDRILDTNQFKQGPKDSPQKDRREAPPRPSHKMTAQNRMGDFIKNQEQNYETPTLNHVLSFGQRQRDRQNIRQTARFEQRQRSRRSSFGGYHNDSPRQKKRQSSKDVRDQYRKDSTPSRFNRRQDQKDRYSFNQRPPVEQKFQLDQINQKSIRKLHDRGFKSSKDKNQLLQQFKAALEYHGKQYLNELFSKNTQVEHKRFISCLSINYDFKEEDATALANDLGKFGPIKLTTIQNLDKKDRTPDKNQRSKQKKTQSKMDRGGYDSKMSPVRDKQQRGRIVDPRRQKVSSSFVKQHIRELLTTFCKKYEPSQLQAYFFGQKDYVERTDFITKIQSIINHFSSKICNSIFDYLKPDSQDRIMILSFKLGMNIDEPIQVDEGDYLPQELQKELKIIFLKADQDHSGFIEPNQIQRMLELLGLNQNLKDIQAYFMRMDQNFDQKISYEQFRIYIEQQVLPLMSTFDQQQQQLEQLLRNNDVFRHGSVSGQTLQALLQKYGVKLTMHQIQILIRQLNPDNTEVHISHFMNAVREPSLYKGRVKGILYKIRLRKKVQLNQIQKIFGNISTCFVMSYTSAQMYRNTLNISTPYHPQLHDSGLFFTDLPIKDIRRVGKSQQKLLGGQLANNDILVQILLKEITGVPIPQKSDIKSNICKRYMNVSVFDVGAELLRFGIWQVQAQWDPDVQDVWRFSNDFRSLLVKIGQFDSRKFQKYVLLFELVIAVVQGNKTIQINCGSASLSMRQLLIPEGRTTKKLKLSGGMPNRSKKIDDKAVSKRTGFKALFGGDVQSQMEIQLVHKNKFQDLHQMIFALPAQIIISRKALHYVWVFRQFMAELAYDGGQANKFLSQDLRILTFFWSLDVPQLFSRIWLWWKQKAQPKSKTLKQAKLIFKILMQELHLIVNSKQFQVLRRYPAKLYWHSRSLMATRNKLIGEVFDNMEDWLSNRNEGEAYRRRRNYGLNYGPLKLHEVNMPKEHIAFMESLAKLASK